MTGLIRPFSDTYADYLGDESRLSGHAQSVSFPKDEAEVVDIFSQLRHQGIPVTVQGGRTGIAGGAVPSGGHLMSLLAMDRVLGMTRGRQGRFLVRVQPGLRLDSLHLQLESGRFGTEGWDRDSLAALEAFKQSGPYFWPPDPTEATATVGGIAGTDAGGPCAHLYGSAGDHIHAVRIMDPKGGVYDIRRGQYQVSPDRLPSSLGKALAPASGTETIAGDMDLLDLLPGSEGCLGIFLSMTLVLRPRPDEMWGILFFFNTLERAAGFIQAIGERGRIEGPRHSGDGARGAIARIAAADIMDRTTLDAVRKLKQTMTRLKRIPEPDPSAGAGVYLEIHGGDTGGIEDMAGQLIETASDFGSDPDRSLACSGASGLQQFRRFRVAAPEAVNMEIDRRRQHDSRILKLGTDMVFPGMALPDLVRMYARDIEENGLEAALFGHGLDRRLHVNILPRDYNDYCRGRDLVAAWAQAACGAGGSPVGEHGVGKLKTHLVGPACMPERLAWQLRLKQAWDPRGLLNPGNWSGVENKQTGGNNG
ncbi:MAG: FAD-binding oxidoreductase [Desulfobacter sp.]